MASSLATMFSILWLCLMLVHPVTSLVEPNKTKLHIGIQTRHDPDSGGLVSTRHWTRYILSTINTREILPGYELIPDFLHITIQGGPSLRKYGLANLTDYLDQTRAYCFIGSYYVHWTKITAEITAAKNLIQISPVNPAPEFSNKTRYPYFLRTSFTDRGRFMLLEKLLDKYKWRKFAVIAQAEEFGPVYTTFLEYLATRNKVPTFASLYHGDIASQGVLSRLKSTGIKIFISFGWFGLNNFIMCEAYKAGLYGKGYVWIHPARFRANPVTNWWNVQFAFYAIANCTVKKSVAGYEKQFVIYDDMEVNLGQPTILQRTVGELIKDASQNDPGEAQNNTDAFSDAFSSRLADAILTCALALNASKQETDQRFEDIPYDSGKKLADTMYRTITNLNFKGFSGDVSYSEKGDRNGMYNVYQVKNGSMGEPVISYFELDDRMVYHQTDEELWQHMGGIPVRDEDLIVVNVVTISHLLSYTYIAIAGVASIIALAFIITQICHRRKSVIKYSWPHLNYTIAVGCISICVVVVLNGFDRGRLTEDGFRLTCEVGNWLLVLGLTLSQGAMLVKLWVIFGFFSHQVNGKKGLADCRNLFAILMMLAIDVGILVAWRVVDPLKIEVEIVSERGVPEMQTVYKDILYKCTSEKLTNWIIAFICYKGIVLILAGIVMWPAWIMSSRLSVSDTQFLGIAVYVNILTCVVVVPVSFLIQQNPSLQYGIVNGFMLASVLLTVCLLWIPKVISICQDTDGRIAMINSPMGAVFGFMRALSDMGALPGAGIDQARKMLPVNVATGKGGNNEKLSN